MEATIVLYTTKNIEAKTTTKLHEKLFGKIQKSNYGRYEYEVKGILPGGAYVRPVRAVIIVKKEYYQDVIDLFDAYGVKHRSFNIMVNSDIFKNNNFFK